MAVMMVMLALVPLYAAWVGNNFVLILMTRIVILAIAAVSLNLIMGYGGMVSFGHAAYLGIGGYVVGILAYEGFPSGFVQWPLAIFVSGCSCPDHRRAVSADPRCVLHHDHARIRADDLLRRRQPEPLWRR